MSSTFDISVLHILSPGGPSPITPVDMTVRICLAGSPPLHSFLRNYDNPLLKRCEPLRPCLSSVTMATMISTSRKKKKKSVVFADSRGLALTAVHIFNEAEDNLLTELQFHLTELEDAVPGLLVLDFLQPAADYLDLRNRLKTQQVCLETCSIQERLVSGTVQVRNLSFKKSVFIRITFDSWHSFQDVPCLYLNNIYGCPDTNTFSFSILVPEVLKPSDTVEFCIQYQTQEHTFWDNNHGKNYQLAVVEPNGSPAQSTLGTAGLKIQMDRSGEKREGIEFDPFGSPRTSAGIFPEWQSWGHIENSTPYW
uniref:Protein phosphatase 1 regulatory subunit n=1 Tax=Mola mola TaxID=94237 RepID=A0A3Q3WIL2_MOLML